MAEVETDVIKFALGELGNFRAGRITVSAGKVVTPQTASISKGHPGVLTLGRDEKHHTQGHTSYWHTYEDGYFMVVGFFWDFAPNIGDTYRGEVLLTKDKKHFYTHPQFKADISEEQEENGEDEYLCFSLVWKADVRIRGTSGSFITGESGDEAFNIDDLPLYEFGDSPVPEMA
ncbi:hypothetical protein [Serratia plymuthica]|uniref:hypothetical protein n=1 Tax=Serratia plymuthica TaxID=82996 RepID=UPI00045667B9|nr:hypothetical protein [Serratia plymuthica]AHY09931.1 hypothetical protein sch_16960 [Serratia plymuthica]MBL3525928.1 hypothetical protein [Serratia plymuthica]